MHLREACVVSQVESGIAMQNLKPTIDNIKRLYGDDKKKVQRETSELYKKAQISPLAGMCKAHLPSLYKTIVLWDTDITPLLHLSISWS